MKKSIITIFAVVSLASINLAMARTLFVSDIDDTIKVSHVLDKSDAVLNALKIRNQFTGMSQFYQMYRNVDPTAIFVYVSSAPEIIMDRSHRVFLRYNKFPPGELFLRKSLQDTQFKLRTIRKLIQTHNPERLILVGDNGEHDPAIYARIHAEYPTIPTFTFIHQLYSVHSKSERGSRLEADQIPFVTAVDLSMRFNEKQLVPFYNETFGFLSKFALSIVKENFKNDDGLQAIPPWEDCRDYFNIVELIKAKWQPTLKWPWQRYDSLYSLLTSYDAKIYSRCVSGPLD